MARRCKHVRAAVVVVVGVVTYECLRCGAKGVRYLGPSNDEPNAVQHAMLDAESIANIGGIDLGWELWDVDGDTQVLWPRPDDWDWDPSRPIAEQLAETARDDAAAELAIQTMERDLTSPALVESTDPAPSAVAEALCDAVAELPEGLDLDAMEYEVTRDAEPDSRDADEEHAIQERQDEFGAPGGVAQVFRDALRRDEPTEYEYAMRDSTPVDPTSAEVCACTGDALDAETCEPMIDQQPDGGPS